MGGRRASAAELSQGLVDADAGPDGDGIGRAPFAGPAGRDHGAGADEAFEIRSVGVEGAELGDGSTRRRHHRAVAGPGPTDGFGEPGAQFPDSQ